MGWPASLVLAGCGKMGGALLRGWLAGGLPATAIHVIDPHLDDETSALCRERGISLDPPATAPEVLVLAVKPQTFAAAPSAFALLARPETLVISILAGKTSADLRAGLPNAGAIVRAMPNLPAAVGRGATGLCGEMVLSAERRAVATMLMACVGLVEWVDEAQIDVVTAVSGSGPAYVFLLVEALAQAGVAEGLPADIALRLARATVEGAGALLQGDARGPAALREAVTSPGGTTAAALDVLRAPDGLPSLIAKAEMAARRRDRELAG